MLIDSLKTKLTIIHALKAMLNNIINSFSCLLLRFVITYLAKSNSFTVDATSATKIELLPYW